MRRFLLTLAFLLVLPSAALAADLTTGDGSLSVTGASGTIVIQGKGVIYGHFDAGTLMVLSYKPDDGVSVPAVTSDKTQYSKPGAGSLTGTDVRFLFPSGRYTIELIAVNLNASGIGKGSIVASGLALRRQRLVLGQRQQALPDQQQVRDERGLRRVKASS